MKKIYKDKYRKRRKKIYNRFLAKKLENIKKHNPSRAYSLFTDSLESFYKRGSE